MKTLSAIMKLAILCFSSVFTVNQELGHLDWDEWSSLPVDNDLDLEDFLNNSRLMKSNEEVIFSRQLNASRELEFYAAKCDRSDLCGSLSHFPVCHCDEKCFEFGDCCLEKISNDASINEIFFPAWECLPLSVNENFVSEQVFAYAIAKCPKGSDEGLAFLCSRQRREPRNAYDHLMDVPVYSGNTSLLYANVFCAQCNSDDKNLTSWNVRIGCDSHFLKNNLSQLVLSGEAIYIPGQRQWILTETKHQCRLYIENFESSSGFIESAGVRQCVQSTSDCPDEQSSLEDKRKCKHYSAYVETQFNGKMEYYKNWHCAICNGVPRDQINCYGFLFREIENFAIQSFNYYSIRQVKFNSECKGNEVFDFVLHESCHSFSHPLDSQTPATGYIPIFDRTGDKSTELHVLPSEGDKVKNQAPEIFMRQVVIALVLLCYVFLHL